MWHIFVLFELILQFVNTRTVLQIPAVTPLFYAHAQELKRRHFLHKRVTSRLRSFLGSDDFYLFLSLWKEAGYQSFLSGSLLLWALDDEATWTPNDIDVVIFVPEDGCSLMQFENWYLRNDGESELAYAAFVKDTLQEKDAWNRARIQNRSKPSFFVDAIFRPLDSIFGEEEKGNLVWSHLQAYDLPFVRNSWTPNQLVVFHVSSIVTRSGIHRDPSFLSRSKTALAVRSFHHSAKTLYWWARVEKYQERGFSIFSQSQSQYQE